MAENSQPPSIASLPSLFFDPSSISFLLGDSRHAGNHTSEPAHAYVPVATTTWMYRSPTDYVVPLRPHYEHDGEGGQSGRPEHLSNTGNTYRPHQADKARYPTNEKTRSEDRFRPDAPVIFVAPFIDMLLLPPDKMGSLNIRGYCTPGYQADKAARIRNNDEDPWRVYLHEYFHFAKVHGGDGSEKYVHMLEHWRMENELGGG